MILKEHEKYKDYYYIPSIKNYIVNRKGNFISLINNKEIETITLNNKLTLFIRIIKDYGPVYLNASRLVALTFLDLPEKIKNNTNKASIIFKDNNPKNINENNLKWITFSDRQNLIWEKIYNDAKIKFPLETYNGDGFYPNPYKNKEYPGFYRIPILDDFLIINKEGIVIRLTTGRKVSIGKHVKGYATINVRTKESRTVLLIHRILGMLFIKIPLHLSDKNFDEIQINHIDGDKTNNELDNLEWVTGKENIEHACETNLINVKKVLRRNIYTNEIKKYNTIRDCCRDNCIDKNMLFKHLNSISYGRIIKDNNVFKFDNNITWPDLLAIEHVETTLWKNCDVVAKNVLTNKICLFVSLRQACLALNLSLLTLQNIRSRKGFSTPYENWIFYPLDDSNI